MLNYLLGVRMTMDMAKFVHACLSVAHCSVLQISVPEAHCRHQEQLPVHDGAFLSPAYARANATLRLTAKQMLAVSAFLPDETCSRHVLKKELKNA